MLCHSHWFSACSRHKDTHTFVSSHTELPQLADGIRADTGRPARLCAMAPSSRAVVCLTTWRTGEETGARATATLYPQAVRHGNHCHSPDISAGQRWWLSAPAAGLCLLPLCHSLQPNTAEPATSMARGPVLNTCTILFLPSELDNMVWMNKTTPSAKLCRVLRCWRDEWETLKIKYSWMQVFTPLATNLPLAFISFFQTFTVNVGFRQTLAFRVWTHRMHTHETRKRPFIPITHHRLMSE